MSEPRPGPPPALISGVGRIISDGLNRVLALDSRARERAAALNGRSLLLDLRGTGLLLRLSFHDTGVELAEARAEETADTIVRGGPGDLFAAALPEWGARDSRVSIEGDTQLARSLQKLFGELDPDWEAPLSRLLGDVAGYQVAGLIRAGSEWMRNAARSSAAMGRDYLRTESRMLADPHAFETFRIEVENLRDATERLEARVRRQLERTDSSAGNESVGDGSADPDSTPNRGRQR